MNNKLISEQIEKELIEEFDFKKCHAIMVLTDHKWGVKNKVPSKKEIKEYVKEMIETMNRTRSEYVSSGGLNLYFHNNIEDPFLELTYTPVSSLAFINNEV